MTSNQALTPYAPWWWLKPAVKNEVDIDDQCLSSRAGRVALATLVIVGGIGVVASSSIFIGGLAGIGSTLIALPLFARMDWKVAHDATVINAANQYLANDHPSLMAAVLVALYGGAELVAQHHLNNTEAREGCLKKIAEDISIVSWQASLIDVIEKNKTQYSDLDQKTKDFLERRLEVLKGYGLKQSDCADYSQIRECSKARDFWTQHMRGVGLSRPTPSYLYPSGFIAALKTSFSSTPQVRTSEL